MTGGKPKLRRHIREILRQAGREWIFIGFDGQTHAILSHVSGARVKAPCSPRSEGDAIETTLQKMRRALNKRGLS